MPKRPHSSLLKTFGINIRVARVRAELTQEGLAAAIKTNQSFISKIENGDSAATIETVERLARALDIHPAELFIDPKSGRT